MNLSRLAVNLIFFFNGFLYVSWAARTPLIQKMFDLDYDQLGFMLLSSSLGSVLAMPIAGFLINKYGSRIVTIGTAILFYISIPSFTLATNYYQLIGFFFFMGASVGTMDVAMNGQAVEVERKMDKPIMSFFHAMFSIGMMVAAASVSLIEKINIGLQQHLFIVSIIAFVIFIINIRHLIADDVVTTSETAEAEKKFYFPTGILIVYGLIAFCCMLGEGAMAEWTANYMKQVALSSDVLAPIGLFSFSGAMTIGRLLGDRARYSFGDRNLILYGGILATMGLSICIIFPLPVVVIVGLFIVGIGLSTVVPIVYSLAGNIPGVKAGVGISAVTTIGYSGFLFGPPIIGMLAEYFGLRISWAFVLLLFITMVIIVLLRKRQSKTIQKA